MPRLDELVEQLGGTLSGDGATCIERVATLDGAEADCISFLSNPRYVSRLATSRAAAFILAPEAREQTDKPCIITPDPYIYFARVSQYLNPRRRPESGVHAAAVVASKVPASASIGPGAVVGVDVQLGEDVVIEPGCYVGEGVRIGKGSWLHAGVCVYADSEIGADCLIHANAVIGADGFGFARQKDGSWLKIPQIGRVIIGDDVEVGAGTTIDRGALDDTVIGNGVKLDNHIQVAHNVRIGDHTAIAGCVGIAGSTVIGQRCMIGGGVGIVGHIEIVDDVVISAGTLVTKGIREKGVYTSTVPLQKHTAWIRNFSHLRQLDALATRVKELEKRLKEQSTSN